MSTRDVYDTIYDPNGAPWPGLKVTFDLIPSSYVLNGAYPSKRVSAVTDAAGAFTLTLWCSDEGLAQTSYQVTYPNDRFTVRVPVGTGPITLSELRALTAPENQPTPPALAAHEAAADPHPGYIDAAELAAALAGTEPPQGGATASPRVLVEWTEGEAYQMLAMTYHATYTSTVAGASVLWPDGSAGQFTADTINPAYEAIDAYHVTHTASGKRVTQAAVTRNANGDISSKPALAVT